MSAPETETKLYIPRSRKYASLALTAAYGQTSTGTFQYTHNGKMKLGSCVNGEFTREGDKVHLKPTSTGEHWEGKVDDCKSAVVVISEDVLEKRKKKCQVVDIPLEGTEGFAEWMDPDYEE